MKVLVDLGIKHFRVNILRRRHNTKKMGSNLAFPGATCVVVLILARIPC